MKERQCAFLWSVRICLMI